MISFSRLFSSSSRCFRRLSRDRRGNVLMMMGLFLVPVMFAVGFGLDYGRAERSQTKLNAVADAAALLAVSPAMLQQTDSVAANAAQSYFTAQAANLAGVTVTSLVVTAPTTSSGALAGTRVATLTFKATSTNLFAGILGVATLPISGTSVADASVPPSINFYVAMDTSPSMLLPTASTGITNLIAGARWNGEAAYYGQSDGCDFACHATNMQQWNQGTYVIDASKNAIYLNNTTSSAITFYRVSCGGQVYDNANNLLGSNATVVTSSGSATATYCSGNGPAANPVYLKYKPSGSSSTVSVSVNFPDTWWLARNYAVVNPGQSQINLRTDDESYAAGNLIQYAYNLQQTYVSSSVPLVYQMQFFTFNVSNPATLAASPFNAMTNVSTLKIATFPDLGAQAPLLASATVNNPDTNFTMMLNWMKSTVPATAGLGTVASPQSVLVIITDGAQDDASDGMGALNANNITQCNAIKQQGTRIAILYTQYLPATINYTANPTFNTFSTTNVPQIQPQLQACASQNSDGSYLMMTVTTNQSISDSLNKLFAMAVQTAHLIK